MATNRSVVYASTPTQVPKVQHWAIITGSTKDDGYGGSSNHVEYVAYLDRAEWEAEIVRREQDRGFASAYTAIEVRPALVKREIVVT